MLLADHFRERFRTVFAGEYKVGHRSNSKVTPGTATRFAFATIVADGPPRMVKRPTGSGGEPSSPNCGASAGGKARQPPFTNQAISPRNAKSAGAFGRDKRESASGVPNADIAAGVRIASPDTAYLPPEFVEKLDRVHDGLTHHWRHPRKQPPAGLGGQRRPFLARRKLVDLEAAILQRAGCPEMCVVAVAHVVKRLRKATVPRKIPPGFSSR